MRRTPQNFWMYGSIIDLIFGRMLSGRICSGVLVAVRDPAVRADTTVAVAPRVADTCGTGGGLARLPGLLFTIVIRLPGVHATGKDERWIGVCVRIWLSKRINVHLGKTISSGCVIVKLSRDIRCEKYAQLSSMIAQVFVGRAVR